MRQVPSLSERLLRAVVFAFVGLVLSAGAHWAGSDMLPGWPTLLVAFVALSAVGWWVGARSRGILILVALTVVSQLGLHAAFAWSMGGRGTAMLLCGMPHGDTASTAQAMFEAQVGHSSSSSWVSGLPMLAAHAVAAVLLGLWLRFGERALDLAGAALDVIATNIREPWIVFHVLVRSLVVGRSRSGRETQKLWPAVRTMRGRTVGASGLRGPPVAQPFWA